MNSKEYNNQLMQAFTKWSENYEKDVEEKIKNRGYSYDILADEIFKYINDKDNMILELGTGPGLVGKRIRTKIGKNKTLDGIDISDKMLKKAKEKKVYNNLFLISSDDFLKENKYDFIYTSFMFHSLNKQEKLLNNMYLSLKEKGHLIIIDLIPSEKTNNSYDHSLKFEYGAPSNYLNLEELKKLVNRTNFTIEKFYFLGEKRDYNHYLMLLNKENKWI